VIRCLHLADLHLGWTADFLGEKAEEYVLQRDGLLGRICEFALQPDQQIGLVLIVGDLFETHRPATGLVESVIADLARLTRAGISVVTVPGNHDEITYHDSVYRRYADRWPGLLVTNPLPGEPLQLTVQGEDVYLYSLAYTGGLTRVTDYLQPQPRLTAEGIHVGAFHGSLDWATSERGLPLSSELLAAAGYDYVALGHFHAPRQLQRGQTTLAYAGAVESKGFSDLGCGQLTLVDLAPGTVQLSQVRCPVQPFRVVSIPVDEVDSREELVAQIAALADPALALRVELEGAAEFLLEREQLSARLQQEFFYLEIVDESLYLSDDLLQSWSQEATVRGLYVQRMLRRLHDAQSAKEKQVLQLALRRGMAAFLEGGA
jgi:exonuclease SbcD